MCPVKAWANTVQRVRKIPGSSDKSEVCLFLVNKKTTCFLKAEHVRTRHRAIVALIGDDILGFSKDDIGLHSIRSGGAMFLSGTSVIIIMKVGHWSSKAFLEYIREQVETFTLEVSQGMLKFEEFFNLNSERKTESTHQVLKTKNIKNEDGPDSLLFCVKFNEIALNVQNKKE